MKIMSVFFAEYEIDRALDEWRDDEVVGPAVLTLDAMRDWTNRNSDGWAYWMKPANAAGKLGELVRQAEDHGRREWRRDAPAMPTQADLKAALKPVKTFRTRYAREFEERKGRPIEMFKITEKLPTQAEKLTAEAERCERAARDHLALSARYDAEAATLRRALAGLPEGSKSDGLSGAIDRREARVAELQALHRDAVAEADKLGREWRASRWDALPRCTRVPGCTEPEGHRDGCTVPESARAELHPGSTV